MCAHNPRTIKLRGGEGVVTKVSPAVAIDMAIAGSYGGGLKGRVVTWIERIAKPAQPVEPPPPWVECWRTSKAAVIVAWGGQCD